MVGRSCFAAVDVKGSRDLVSCPATASGRKSGARRRHPNVDGDESEAGDGAQMPRGEPGPELRAYEHGQQARESERGGGSQEYAGAIDLRAGPQPLSSHARARDSDSCPNHLLGSSSLLPWVSDPPPRGWPEPSTRNGPGFGLSPAHELPLGFLRIHRFARCAPGGADSLPPSLPSVLTPGVSPSTSTAPRPLIAGRQGWKREGTMAAGGASDEGNVGDLAGRRAPNRRT